MFVAFSRSLFWKLFLPIGGLLIVCGIAAAIFLPILIRSNAEAEAVSVGLDTLTQFKTLRGYYTENVVSKLLAKGDIKPGAEHKGNPDRVPLPATMILDLSDLLQKEGTTLKLYSPYPFPNRKGRVLDDFGQAAWDYLHHHPDQTFSRTEVVNGKPIDTLRLIRDDASSVSAASAEIATSNSEFSARTEQQASSLEETASSMEELTSTVKANADHVNQANRLAVSAHDIAANGGEIMQQVIGTMASINESTKKITDITSVIDGIAFQTNILALNAAVEAARAGEQGRGFAVVAAEVRTLAQRSAAAAREIKAIADESVEKVEQGEKLAAQSGETMHGIVDGIRQVTDLMNDIATASGEQSSGIEQVGQAVMLIDDATQKNAALVEEIAAAAEALQQKANNLEQAVQRFNLP